MPIEQSMELNWGWVRRLSCRWSLLSIYILSHKERRLEDDQRVCLCELRGPVWLVYIHRVYDEYKKRKNANLQQNEGVTKCLSLWTLLNNIIYGARESSSVPSSGIGISSFTHVVGQLRSQFNWSMEWSLEVIAPKKMAFMRDRGFLRTIPGTTSSGPRTTGPVSQLHETKGA